MKITQRKEGADQRRILIAMIMDRRALAVIASKWHNECFASRWANIVGEWCVKYYRKYNKSPKRAIEGLFETWAEKADNDTKNIVERFLSGLSEEYESGQKHNSDYIIDLAARHFSIAGADKVIAAAQGDLANGDVEKAYQRMAAMRKVEIGQKSGTNVLADKDIMMKAFDLTQQKSLIDYPGALGEFWGNSLERDGFIAIMAPEKRGKTFVLLDFAWHGVLQRNNVAFFQLGDLSENQMMRRFGIRAAYRPLKPGTVTIPTEMWRDGEGEESQIELKTEEREYKDTLDGVAAWTAAQRIAKGRTRSSTCLRLSCHPNSTLSAQGMKDILKEWEHADGFIPDIIVADYADLIANPHGFEGRDAINETWKRLRAISQETHSLVITATQASAESYHATVMDRSHFSEDKRKYAHVTGMISLNQTPEEKERGIMRWNWLVRREEAYSERRSVYVAGNLAIASPCMVSTW